jgi:pimeloyl-ACP methyl ester carboxylesterase
LPNPLRAPLLHFLADRFRLVRYDGRCNGLSDWDVTDVSFAALQHDLDTVVDALGLRSYALLGISQGASMSIAHAVRYPERVSKIVPRGTNGHRTAPSAQQPLKNRVTRPEMRGGVTVLHACCLIRGAQLIELQWLPSPLTPLDDGGPLQSLHARDDMPGCISITVVAVQNASTGLPGRQRLREKIGR